MTTARGVTINVEGIGPAETEQSVPTWPIHSVAGRRVDDIQTDDMIRSDDPLVSHLAEALTLRYCRHCKVEYHVVAWNEHIGMGGWDGMCPVLQNPGLFRRSATNGTHPVYIPYLTAGIVNKHRYKAPENNPAMRQRLSRTRKRQRQSDDDDRAARLGGGAGDAHDGNDDRAAVLGEGAHDNEVAAMGGKGDRGGGVNGGGNGGGGADGVVGMGGGGDGEGGADGGGNGGGGADGGRCRERGGRRRR